jgi:hypothetical protein
MATEDPQHATAAATESTTTTRRGFLAVTGAASCLVLTGGVARALAPESEEVRRARTAARAASPSHALMAALPPGTALHTSTIAAVHPVNLGAVAVVMRRPDGSAFQLDVLGRADRDGSIAQSGRCSVFAVNGGTGRSATAEPDGLAAMALAAALTAAERAGLPTPALMTHAERAQHHPLGSYRVTG